MATAARKIGYDPEKVHEMVEPLNVRIEKYKGGPLPVWLPPRQENDEDGQGYFKTDLPTIESLIVYWAGSGNYKATISDGSGKTMSWQMSFTDDPTQYPPHAMPQPKCVKSFDELVAYATQRASQRPPAVPAQAQPQQQQPQPGMTPRFAGAPRPPVAGWGWVPPAPQAQPPIQQGAWNMPQMGYDPSWAWGQPPQGQFPFGYGPANQQYPYGGFGGFGAPAAASSPALTELQLQLEKERHERERDKDRAEAAAQLKTLQDELRRLSENPKGRSDDAEERRREADERKRDDERREEKRAAEEQRREDKRQQEMKDLELRHREELRRISDDMKAQSQANMLTSQTSQVIGVMQSVMTQQSQLFEKVTTSNREAMDKQLEFQRSAPNGTDLIFKHISGLFGLQQQMTQTIMEQVQSQQPAAPHPALQITDGVLSSAKEVLGRYFGMKEQETGAAAAMAQARAVEAQAQAATVHGFGAPIPQQPVATPIPTPADSAGSPLNGAAPAVGGPVPMPTPPGARDMELFGLVLPEVENLRVGVYGGHLTPQATGDAIFEAMLQIEEHKLKIPAFDLVKEGKLAELLEAILPRIAQTYREEAEKQLVERIKELAAEQEGEEEEEEVDPESPPKRAFKIIKPSPAPVAS